MKERIIACCKKEIKKRPYQFFTVILTASALAIGFISALLTLSLQSLIAAELTQYFHRHFLLPLYPQLSHFVVNTESSFLPIFLIVTISIICFLISIFGASTKSIDPHNYKKFVFRWLIINAGILSIFIWVLLPLSIITVVIAVSFHLVIIFVYFLGVINSVKFRTFLAEKYCTLDINISYIPLLNFVACCCIFILLPHVTQHGHSEYLILLTVLFVVTVLTPFCWLNNTLRDLCTGLPIVIWIEDNLRHVELS